MSMYLVNVVNEAVLAYKSMTVVLAKEVNSFVASQDLSPRIALPFTSEPALTLGRRQLRNAWATLHSQLAGWPDLTHFELWRLSSYALTLDEYVQVGDYLRVFGSGKWDTAAVESELIAPFVGRVDTVLAELKETSALCAEMVKMNDLEHSIMKVLCGKTLIRNEIANRLLPLGFEDNSHLKMTLSSLVKRGILRNKSPGYVIVEPWPSLSKSGQSQD